MPRGPAIQLKKAQIEDQEFPYNSGPKHSTPNHRPLTKQANRNNGNNINQFDDPFESRQKLPR